MRTAHITQFPRQARLAQDMPDDALIRRCRLVARSVPGIGIAQSQAVGAQVREWLAANTHPRAFIESYARALAQRMAANSRQVAQLNSPGDAA